MLYALASILYGARMIPGAFLELLHYVAGSLLFTLHM